MMGYRGEREDGGGVLVWGPIVESQARLGGVVGSQEEGVHLHAITIACVRPYITGGQAALAVDRRTVHSEERHQEV